MCILTSNHEHAIDPAFMRRLACHIRFEDPDLDERTRLWTRIVPAEVPVANAIDAAKLASAFKLSGGSEYEAMGRLPPCTADQLA